MASEVTDVVRSHGRELRVETDPDGMSVLLISIPTYDGIRFPLSDDERDDLIRALGGIAHLPGKWTP